MAVTMTAPAQHERDGAYARLEERILARDQVGASQVFYDLVKAGRPVDELVRETVRIHAPYTHMPFHQRIDSGDVRFVNNDHCLLSMRAALQLKKLVSDEIRLPADGPDHLVHPDRPGSVEPATGQGARPLQPRLQHGVLGHADAARRALGRWRARSAQRRRCRSGSTTG